MFFYFSSFLPSFFQNFEIAVKSRIGKPDKFMLQFTIDSVFKSSNDSVCFNSIDSLSSISTQCITVNLHAIIYT